MASSAEIETLQQDVAFYKKCFEDEQESNDLTCQVIEAAGLIVAQSSDSPERRRAAEYLESWYDATPPRKKVNALPRFPNG